MEKDILNELKKIYLKHRDFSVDMINYKENIEGVLKEYRVYLDKFNRDIEDINDKIISIKEKETIGHEDKKNLEFIQVLLIMGQQELTDKIKYIFTWFNEIVELELELTKDVFKVKRHLGLCGEHLTSE